MALNHSAQSGRAPIRERKDDLYETPEAAVAALLDTEKLPHCLWEPACGPGAIVRVLRRAGHFVHASDLVDYGCPDSHSRADFLMTRFAPEGAEAIVTNPPFKLANEFVSRGLELVPKIYMLLRLAFIESTRRSPILDSGTLARVHVFRNRLPRMHRGGWQGREASSSICFAWFIWDREHRGPTELRRLSWSEKATPKRESWSEMWARPYGEPAP